MADKCSRNHSQYMYNASAYGLAGEFIRPHRHSIPTQAATVLTAGGGRGSQRVENFRFESVVSFDAAYVEVGGSFDECHHIHTTYAHSVIEKLNIADVVKADKVVSRLSLYSPHENDKNGEPSYDITGSHFENLRIAGHKLDVKLATHRFHDCHTFGALEDEYQKKSADDLLCMAKLSQEPRLKALEADYHALAGLSEAADRWKSESKKRARGNHSYWCSAVNDLAGQFGKESEVKTVGCFICIPKFGVVRLAEVIIHRNYRSLNMVRIQMCSGGDASIDGGGTSGGTGGMGPRP